jgi:hypothetical protein
MDQVSAFVVVVVVVTAAAVFVVLVLVVVVVVVVACQLSSLLRGEEAIATISIHHLIAAFGHTGCIWHKSYME